MGEMPRAAERGDNYHMQSGEAACQPDCAEWINHFTWLLCYYQRNRGTSCLSSPTAAGIRSKRRPWFRTGLQM